VRGQIASAARAAGAAFHSLTPQHWTDYFRWQLLEREHGAPRSVVVLDPDVVFWKSVEDWDFGSTLVAGRLIPQLGSDDDPLIGMPRLHSSFLWVPDIGRLRQAVLDESQPGVPWDCISERQRKVEGSLHLWDTFAELYGRLGARCTPFSEEALDCYDHLFYGSYFPLLDAGMPASFDAIRMGHAAAASNDLTRLKGI